jgi:integrase
LVRYFDTTPLSEIDVAAIEKYVAGMIRDGANPRTANSHLRVMSLIFKAALKRKLVASNPIPMVDRPRVQEKSWRILSPVEIGSVVQAFDALIEEAEDDRRDDLIVSKAIFIVAVDRGPRRGEILGLKWRHVALADPDGAHLRFEETFTRSHTDTPKSKASRRTITIGRKVGEVLFDLRARTIYEGDDEFVFANPRTGRPFDVLVYGKLYREALAKAGITDDVRPFHDLRHTSLTNGSKSGMSPAALQARAGHSSFSTTQTYIDLAGERFRDEEALSERRLWGEQEAVAVAEE